MSGELERQRELIERMAQELVTPPGADRAALQDEFRREHGLIPDAVTPEEFRREREGNWNQGHPSGRKAGALTPEWAMYGCDVPAGKRIYASRDLSSTELEVWDSGNGGSADGWHLTTNMARLLVITKPTYTECLAELMRIWQNWERNERELTVSNDKRGRELPAAPDRAGYGTGQRMSGIRTGI